MALALVPNREVSLPDVVDATTLAGMLGLHRVSVQRRADAERWLASDVRCRGGRRRLYTVESLPADVFEALLRHTARSASSPAVPEPEAPPAELALVRDADRETALARATAVDAWHAWSKAHRPRFASLRQAQDAWCAEYSAAHPETALSRATLIRWREAYQQHGVSGLVPGYRARGKAAQWPSAARLYLRACWLRKNEPSMQLAIRELRWKAEQQGWTLPSDQTLRRFLQDIPRYTQAKLRKGDKAADACLPYIERSYAELLPNDIWVADHEVFDLEVLTPDGRIIRPWATAYQDAASRRIVGRCITEMPSSDTIAVAFARGCRKNGVPKAAYQDNGADFSSKRIAGGVHRARHRRSEEEMHGLYLTLGVNCHFAIPGNAKAKIVERWFGGQREAFDKAVLRGYVGRSPEHRPEGSEVARKRGDLLTLAEFTALFDAWVEDVYHQTPHHGEGMRGRTPNQAWNDGREAGAEIRMASPATLALLMGQAKEVVRTGQGVRVEKRNFWSEELVRKVDIGERVVARYDREDLDVVQLFDPEGRYLCEAQAVARTAYFDKEAPHALGKKKKFVRDLHAAEIAEVRAAQRGLHQDELVLGVPTVSTAVQRPAVVTALRTPLDPVAREAAKRDETRRVEKARKADALAKAEAKLAALAEREATTPAAAEADAWRSLRRAMGVE